MNLAITLNVQYEKWIFIFVKDNIIYMRELDNFKGILNVKIGEIGMHY